MADETKSWITKKKKKYKLGLESQGDYKGKSIPGKAKEFVETGVKQTVGTATDIKNWITKKKKTNWITKKKKTDWITKKKKKDYTNQ